MIAMSYKKQYLGKKAVGIKKYSVGKRVRSAAVGLAVSLLAGVAQAATTVQDIEFSSRPGSKFEVRVEFNETPPDIKAATITAKTVRTSDLMSRYVVLGTSYWQSNCERRSFARD